MAQAKRNVIKALIDKYKNSSVIFKASLWFVFVTVINNGVSVLTQPFINRILTVEEVGVYGVYHTWQSIFSIIATLNLFCGVLEVLITKNKEDSKHIVASLSILSILVWGIFFGICLIFINPISTLLRLKPIYLIVLAVTIIVDALVQFWCVQKRFFYKYKSYSVLMICLFIIKAITSILLAYWWENDRILGRIVGLCFPTLFVAVVLFILMIRRLRFKRITQYWWKAVKFNIPLIPHYLSSILLASSDKIMIQRFVGETGVGLYTLAYSFSSLALIVFGALNNAYTPHSLKLIKDENYTELSRTTKPIVLLSVVFSLLLIFLAPEGILILGGKKYLKTLDIVPILIVGIFFSSFYFIFSNVEFLYEKTKLIFPITLLGAGLNILLNWLFIPRFGYKVAAYTTLVSYMIVAVCHYLISFKILKRNIYPMKSICFYVLLLIVGGLGAIFLYKLQFWIRYAILLALCVGIVIVTISYLKKKKVILNKNVSIVETEGENTI